MAYLFGEESFSWKSYGEIMKTKLIAGVVVALMASAAGATDIVKRDWGRVLSVEPITKNVYTTVPRTSCVMVDEVTHSQSRSNTAPVIGAIVGGTIGHNIAKDKGTGVVVGSIAGAVIGDHMSEGSTSPSVRSVERCSTYHDRVANAKIIGYNVTFEYNGEIRTTKMNRDPGMQVPIKTVTRIYVLD